MRVRFPPPPLTSLPFVRVEILGLLQAWANAHLGQKPTVARLTFGVSCDRASWPSHIVFRLTLRFVCDCLIFSA